MKAAAGVSLIAALTWCIAAPADARDWAAERARMVEQQLRARDIRSERVLDAMLKVPRHLFVPEPVRAYAYRDHAVPIGHEQTISQPYIVAFMTQGLDVGPNDRVLEIGTGSGYQAAVLSLLAKDVYTIEIIAPLAERARATLKSAGYGNVEVRTGNGYLGWPEHAPFDRIMVTAAPDEVPPALVQQLKIGGLMAIPVGTGEQELRILRRTESGLTTLATLPVRFVPMTGKPRQRDTDRLRGALRPADRPHLPGPAPSAVEPLAAVGLEAGHAHSGRHLERLQNFSRSRIDSPQLALVTFPGGMPELAIDPGHPGDEAVGFDRAKDRTRLRIDLMDLPVPVFPDPQRAFGPGRVSLSYGVS